MAKGYVAVSRVQIKARPSEIWDFLVNPEKIKAYMFGSIVESSFKVGDGIVWKGVWQGKPYEDKGKILAVLPGKELSYSHFSPLSGQADAPENYHVLTFRLEEGGSSTELSVSQDNNANPEEQKHSEGMYASMLEGMKKLIEG